MTDPRAGADTGHVFVVRGDLALVACDDVLVPSDEGLNVTTGFRRLVEDVLLDPATSREQTSLPGADGHDRVDPTRVHRLGAGLARVGGDDARGRWLLDTESSDVRVLVEQVDRLLRTVARERAGEHPRFGRAKRLLAMPLVGTGEGGAAGRRGDVIAALLPLLQDLAAELDLDVALVLADHRDHCAAQEVRRRCLDDWPLDRQLLERADDLARLASDGRLSLFVGAGASRAAGLPVWSELLDALAREAGLTEQERRRLGELQPPDAAEVLRHRLGASRMGQRLADMFDRQEHALSQALLAALPVGQLVTTNYDAQLELAFRAAGRRLEVLPAAEGGGAPGSGAPSQPWLVKLHGDISRPQDVVLTRSSFVELADEQAALAGVVPTLLLTSHVLFVGFSLLDDTFLRAAHQTRRVLERSGGPRACVGTALGLPEDPLRRDLFAEDVDYVFLAEEHASLAGAARRLEVFLDRLAAQCARDPGWLLDARYAGMRSPADAELAEALEALVERCGRGPERSTAWASLQAALDRLGERAEDISDSHT